MIHVVKAKLDEANVLFKIYVNAKIALNDKGINQWTNDYPSLKIIKNDIKKGSLYVLKDNCISLGAIQISEEQEPEYSTINWQFKDPKVLVIHRLVIAVAHQQKGYSKILMDFAENYAKQNNYKSIRLDAYSKNLQALNLYKNRNYKIRGKVYFKDRIFPFYCLEKEMDNN